MASNELLKIPKRPIFIKHDNEKIAVLSVNHEIYLFNHDKNTEKIHINKIRYHDNYKIAIKEKIYEITENDEDYTNKTTTKEIAEQRSETIIKRLETAIKNNKSNGQLFDANNNERYHIIDILNKNGVKNPFEENTNLNNIKINNSDILEQLITGKHRFFTNKIVRRDETLNELAVLLKTELGLKQELEIKKISLENVIYDLYIKTEYNTMQKVSFEELYEITLKLMHGTDNITHNMETNFKRKDLKDILSYIPSSYRKYNILTLNNGLYDLRTHEFLNPEKIIEKFGEPILTQKTVPYNYNPQAKGTKIREILRYAFDKYNPKYNPKTKEIKGFYEIGGYSLRSGNTEQKIVFMFGVANSSKSVLNNLITAIHDHKVSSLPLEKFIDRFGTSALLNVQLNTIRDINNAKIKDNSMIKISSGNEPLHFESKGKPHGIIPAIEVPLSIASGNVLLKFEKPEIAILRRLLHLEFKNRVPTATKTDNNNVIEWNEDDQWIIDDLRNKEKKLGVNLNIPHVIKDIDKTISNDDDEMEFLLYQFLEHDKVRINENNHIFSIEKTYDEILNDLKLYSNPIETLLVEIIEYDTTIKEEYEDTSTNENVGIAANELYDLLREQSRMNYVDIPKDNITLGKEVKKAIVNIFDLDKTYNTKNNRSKLNRNNEIESCKPTRVYPKIQYKLLKTNKKRY